MERLLERKMRAWGVELTAGRALEELSRLHVVPTEIKDQKWLVRAEPSDQACEIFKALRYRVPSRIQPATIKQPDDKTVMPNSEGQLPLELLI